MTELSWSDIDKALDRKYMLPVRWITEALRYDEFNHDALSKCQMMSKARLLSLMQIVNGSNNIAICGCWYGQLAQMLATNKIGTSYTGIDIDPSVEKIASHLNRYIPYTHITDDMYMIDYEGFDTVINTSCEHIEDLKEWLDCIPDGTRVVLQSNNYLDADGHVNCSQSLEEFKDKAKLSTLLVDDELKMPLYTRYTLIGRV